MLHMLTITPENTLPTHTQTHTHLSVIELLFYLTHSRNSRMVCFADGGKTVMIWKQPEWLTGAFVPLYTLRADKKKKNLNNVFNPLHLPAKIMFSINKFSVVKQLEERHLKTPYLKQPPWPLPCLVWSLSYLPNGILSLYTHWDETVGLKTKPSDPEVCL